MILDVMRVVWSSIVAGRAQSIVMYPEDGLISESLRSDVRVPDQPGPRYVHLMG
jgi:hypothetical protein